MGHEIHILFAGRPPPDFALKLAPNTMFREGPKDICEKHKAKIFKSAIIFLFKIPKIAWTRREIVNIAKKENYDIYFTDMEQYAAFAAKKTKKPCFNINHHSSIFFPTAEQLPGNHLDKFLLRFLVNNMSHYFTRCYAIDYCDKIEKSGNLYRYPLINKPELENYQITQDDHIVAYLANEDYKRIIKVFSKFTNETFYVYGFDEDKKINNMIFKKTSRVEFLKDLTSAKAVIGNAGFSLTWEVCLINKLMWVIPYKRHYEQLVNAHRLTKLNIAYSSKEITTGDFENFSKWLEEKNYESSVKLPVIEAKIILDDIFSCLDDYKQ